MHLTLLQVSLSLGLGHKIVPLRQFCFGSFFLICLAPFSQGLIGLIGWMILIKELVFLTIAPMEKGKRHSVIKAMAAKTENFLLENMNLIDTSHHGKNCVDWILHTW